MNASKNTKAIALGVLLVVLPLVLQQFGNAWVRIADMALLYVLLAVGLNIVVGYAGLLDLGYVAFFAVGAYMYGLLASPHLFETFPAIAAMFPGGLHMPLWVIVPVAAALAGLFGMLLGAPTLKLRGDYLAIVTLGFGEIIRVFLNNLDQPINITNGPKGIGPIDAISVMGYPLSRKLDLGFIELPSVTLYYYLFLLLVVLALAAMVAGGLALVVLAVSFVSLGLHTKPFRIDARPGLVVGLTIPLVLAATGTNNVDLEVDGDSLVTTEPVFGGTTNVKTTFTAGGPHIVLIRPKSFAAEPAGGGAAAVETIAVPDAGRSGGAWGGSRWISGRGRRGWPWRRR